MNFLLHSPLFIPNSRLYHWFIYFHSCLYSVRGLERSELGGSHGCPAGRIWDFYDRSILRPKHRAYYRSGRPVIKIGPKGALGSHEIRPIHSAPSLGQSIDYNSSPLNSRSYWALWRGFLLILLFVDLKRTSWLKWAPNHFAIPIIYLSKVIGDVEN